MFRSKKFPVMEYDSNNHCYEIVEKEITYRIHETEIEKLKEYFVLNNKATTEDWFRHADSLTKFMVVRKGRVPLEDL